MFLSPVGEISRNDKKSFLASSARSASQTAGCTATSSQISRNILSHKEHMFISDMGFLLKFLDPQTIF